MNATEQLRKAAYKHDEAWSAELLRVYGAAAGDARYDRRGRATPLLDQLCDAKLRADKAWWATQCATGGR